MFNRNWILSLKLTAGLAMFGIIIFLADLDLNNIQNINVTILLSSLIPFAVFIWQQSQRFNHLLAKKLLPRTALAVQWRLQFFNIVLPSGFAGDAYRIYIMRHCDETMTTLATKSLVDRLGGFLVNNLFLIGALNFIDLRSAIRTPLLVSTLLLSSVGLAAMSILICRIWPPGERAGIFGSLFLWSFGCWAAQIARLWLLCLAVDWPATLASLAFLLGLTQIAALIPLTIGGLGLVEGALVFAAVAIGVSGPLAATVALLMRATTMLSAVPGFGFWLRGRHA